MTLKNIGGLDVVDSLSAYMMWSEHHENNEITISQKPNTAICTSSTQQLF